jgi:DNA-directed RNA polymerase subunit RPC12/RpoP
MIVLSPKCPGMVVECACGAVLAHTMADVYDGNYVRCPVCGEKIEVRIINVESPGISSKEGQ